MVSFSRRAILPAIVIAVLLAALPGAIQRLIQTGNPYLFTDQFFQDMAARLSGPGRFRFILQPLVAILLGARDGRKDVRAGNPPISLEIIPWRFAARGTSAGSPIFGQQPGSSRSSTGRDLAISNLSRDPSRSRIDSWSRADRNPLLIVSIVDESDRTSANPLGQPSET